MSGTSAERCSMLPSDHAAERRTSAELSRRRAIKAWTAFSCSAIPRPSGCRPSVDPMFESCARLFGGHAMGIVLSGMGRDGAAGAARIADAGGTILAQDAASSAVWGMPGAVATAGLASAVLPPDQLARRVVAAVGAAA